MDTLIIKTKISRVIKTPKICQWGFFPLQSRTRWFLFVISLCLSREFSTSAQPQTSIRNSHWTAQVNKLGWIFSCSAPSTQTSPHYVRTPNVSTSVSISVATKGPWGLGTGNVHQWNILTTVWWFTGSEFPSSFCFWQSKANNWIRLRCTVEEYSAENLSSVSNSDCGLERWIWKVGSFLARTGRQLQSVYDSQQNYGTKSVKTSVESFQTAPAALSSYPLLIPFIISYGS